MSSGYLAALIEQRRRHAALAAEVAASPPCFSASAPEPTSHEKSPVLDTAPALLETLRSRELRGPCAWQRAGIAAVVRAWQLHGGSFINAAAMPRILAHRESSPQPKIAVAGDLAVANVCSLVRVWRQDGPDALRHAPLSTLRAPLCEKYGPLQSLVLRAEEERGGAHALLAEALLGDRGAPGALFITSLRAAEDIQASGGDAAMSASPLATTFMPRESLFAAGWMTAPEPEVVLCANRVVVRARLSGCSLVQLSRSKQPADALAVVAAPSGPAAGAALVGLRNGEVVLVDERVPSTFAAALTVFACPAAVANVNALGSCGAVILDVDNHTAIVDVRRPMLPVGELSNFKRQAARPAACVVAPDGKLIAAVCARNTSRSDGGGSCDSSSSSIGIGGGVGCKDRPQVSVALARASTNSGIGDSLRFDACVRVWSAAGGVPLASHDCFPCSAAWLPGGATDGLLLVSDDGCVRELRMGGVSTDEHQRR